MARLIKVKGEQLTQRHFQEDLENVAKAYLEWAHK